MRRQIRFLGHCVKNFDSILFLPGMKRIYYSRAKLSQRGPKRQLKPAREASRDTTTCMPNYIFILVVCLRVIVMFKIYFSCPCPESKFFSKFF